MRVFLGVLLFDIVFRSLSILLPTGEWARDLDMGFYPVRPFTRAEAETARRRGAAALGASTVGLLASAHGPLPAACLLHLGRPDPVLEDALVTLDSVWNYFKPWPGPATRARIYSGADVGKFVLCWLTSRLGFLENLVGINEDWPMFSPSVGHFKYVGRAWLTYADGSTRTVRLLSDPDDLTHFSHWFQEKRLDHEGKVRPGEAGADDCLGYCNLLAHRYARNEDGAALKRIDLFRVRYDFPPPGVDARAFLEAQNGPPADRVYPIFYTFDAETRHGQCQ
jgi:hypothetical protein